MRFATRLSMLCCATAVATASAEPVLAPRARRHFEAALEAYRDTRYDVAGREFEAAYAIDPDPSLLYAMAQARRQGDRCDLALRFYKLYLATDPKPERRAAAVSGMKRCLEREPVAEPIASTAKRPDPEPAPHDDEPASRPTLTVEPWYRDHAAHALGVSGLASLGTGIGFLIASRRSFDRATATTDHDRFTNALDESTRRRWIGLGTLAFGGALVTAAIVKYASRGVVERRTITADLTRDGGAMVFITGGFR